MNYPLSNIDMPENQTGLMLSVPRLLLVEPTTCSSMSMLDKLAVLDDFRIEKISNLESVPAIVAATQPDMLILCFDAITDVDLTPLIWLKENNPIPVVVFAHQNTPNAVKSVVAAGVSTYIVDDVLPHRLPVILDLAFERFSQMQSVNSELEQTKKKLSERKLIERAKGIVMRQKNYTEEQAYMEIRKSAMNQGKTMADLAGRIIAAFDGILD
jgi:response regulator NasT